MVLKSPAASNTQTLTTREQFTNATVSRSSLDTKIMIAAELTATATIASTDMKEDSSKYQQQSRDTEVSSKLAIEYTKTLETCPSVESNSTEDSTLADDSIANNPISSQLEQKRLALRNQRISLEQKLYEFGTYYNINSIPCPSNPSRHVQDMTWKDPNTGMCVFYSGPLNEQNEPHGSKGVLKFLDGQIYEGEVCRGVRCGHGINSWPDGQQYCGEWSQNSRNGKGRHSWAVQGGGQKVVTGEWRKGRLHGRISFSWPDGSSFDGMAVNGKRHGRGEHRWSSGKIFRGNYECGKAHGFGTLTHSEGTYWGQWKCGLKEGYGTMLWNTRIYSGEWLKDKPHGQGRVVWHNGSTYTGQFARGRYDGTGVYVFPSGKKIVAMWEMGVKSTSQYCSWPDGRTYDGECDSDGNKHGYGELKWCNGTSYVGSFHRNMRHGQGKLVGSGGEIFHDGLWESNLPVDCVIGNNVFDQLAETEHSTAEKEYVDDFFTKVSSSQKQCPIVYNGWLQNFWR